MITQNPNFSYTTVIISKSIQWKTHKFSNTHKKKKLKIHDAYRNKPSKSFKIKKA